MKNKSQIVIGSTTKAVDTFEAFRKSDNKKNKLVVASNSYATNKVIDVSWLKAAAPVYHISDNIEDYIIPIVPIVTSDIPNRNLQAFSFSELSRFDWLKGQMVYQSFIGKMTSMDHINNDPLCSKGVVFDATMHYVPKYNIWKVMLLCGFDRNKDKELVKDIINKKRTGYSMGAFVDSFKCSVCGNVENCSCTKGAIVGNKLVYQQCIGVNYIEASSVDDPADVTAEGSNLF